MYGEKLRELRKIEGWTQEEVAKKLGVSKQTYSHYENEKRRPGLDTIRHLAAVYQVDIDDIFAEETNESFTKLPIVGSISFNNGLPTYEDIEEYQDVPKSWISGSDHFFLRAKGDSMINARIHDGDLLLVRIQDQVKNGEIAAVHINGETVLKKIYLTDDTMVLQNENPNYPPIIAGKGHDIKIIGKLVRNFISY